jgi:hypothetical protein
VKILETLFLARLALSLRVEILGDQDCVSLASMRYQKQWPLVTGHESTYQVVLPS